MVIPDDFTVLTGDMKLEHIPTLNMFYELKRNLGNKREGTLTTQSNFDVNYKTEYRKCTNQTHAVSKVVWKTATDDPFSKLATQ